MSLSATLIFVAAQIIAAVPVPGPEGRATIVFGDTSPGPKKEYNAWFLEKNAKRLKSRRFLETLLRKPGVAGLLPLGLEGDHVAWLQHRLLVRVEPKKNTFTVWVVGFGPRNQALLLNALADIFMAEVTRQHREPLERSIKEREKGHQEWLKRLDRLRENNRITGDPNEAKFIQVWQKKVEAGGREIERLRRELKQPLRLTVVRKAQEKP